MTLRERWNTLPVDAGVGYAAAGSFVLWLAVCALSGPHLFVWAAGCLVLPLLVGVALVLACRLAACSVRRRRVLPMALVSGCLAAFWVGLPAAVCVNLHLIGRVYLADGPEAISNWGQELIREREVTPDGSGSVDLDRLPPGIRTHLSGFVSAGGTLWSDLPRVRIELGGGFYHYGVVVYPRAAAPPPAWWQRVLGWPPEVVIHREE